MSNEFSPEDKHYIAGFDAWCDYITHEIELWLKRHDFEPRVTGPILTLLAHLKSEGHAPDRR
mgnify:CR=1 FL=1